MLQLYLSPQLEDHQQHVVFQLDGAPSHWARIFQEFLDMHFPGHWVGHDGSILWPPQSPDIMLLDLFMWGHIKDIVYKTPVTSLDELKLRIFAVNETVTPQILENTWRVSEYRLGILCATKGAHVEAA
jgi:hypothetical protein